MTSPEPSDPQAPRPSLAARAARQVARRLKALSLGLAGLLAWPFRHRPPAGRAAALVFTSGLLALGLLGVAFPLVLPRLLPSSLDWAGAGALLARDARPGDVVVVSPGWAERARMVAPGGLPVLAQQRYAGEVLSGVRRLWLVSLPDAPGFSWDPELDLLERTTRGEAPVQLGGLQVTRYELAFPDVPLSFLPDRLGRAEVSAAGVPCQADGAGAFHCGPPGSPSVSRSVREVDGVPRPCLVVTGDGEVVLSFPGVPLGRSLRGHAGSAGRRSPPAAGAPAAPPVHVSVAVEGDEVGEAQLQLDGWRAFRIDTSRFAGGPHPVVLTVRAGGAAPFCLDAVTLP